MNDDEGNDKGFIMLINLNIDNEDIWAYMMIPANRYDAFMEAKEQQTCNIKEYGDIIEWGEGTEPPAHVSKRIENEFGIIAKQSDVLNDMSQILEERLKKMNGKE